MFRIFSISLLTLVLTLGLVISTSAGILPEDGDARYELVFWESIKNSQRAADYEAYLEAFPNGRFAPLAKARAAYLRKNEKPSSQSGISKGPRIREIDAQYEVIRTANLRKAPDTNSPPVAILSGGTRVRVTGRVLDADWYRVESNGTTGFIYGDLIREAASSPTPPRPVTGQQKVWPVAPASSPTATAPSTVLGKFREFKDCNECPEMVSLPSGSFVMGDEEGDKSERPARKVSISRPFAIGKYEVTVGQWNACVGTGGCSYRSRKAGNNENMPVRDISWMDAQEYVKWLSERTGESYRLPSEAEWEYAMRGNTSTRYWWGNRFEEGKASCKNCGGPWDRKSPKAVGSYSPNPFGLYDMNGNVWEWVSDCWHNSYSGAPRDGESWEEENCRVRVLRGGSWRNDSNYMYSAVRFKYDADVRYLVNGFRVVKTLK